MAALDHITGLLDQMDIKYTQKNERILTRWETDSYDDLKVSIFTNRDESWLYFLAPFSNFRDLSTEQQNQLAVEMLKASWQVDGVQFAIDDDEDIMVMAETNNMDLSPEQAATLLKHVVGGCNLLHEIHPR
ncbi:MAG: hypothetical protein ACOC38_08075 [Promethearchaeia archaeon]